MRFTIGGMFSPRVVLEIEEDPPPCFWCGVPVKSPSMNGPLMCASCDMGLNADGSRKTDADYARSNEHYKKMVQKYQILIGTYKEPPSEEKT